METNQPTMKKARVVLRAHGGKRHHLAVSDGSESRDSAVEADAMSMNVESTHYDHSMWDTLPIKSDNELQMSPPTVNNHILHSTPLKPNCSSRTDVPMHSPHTVAPAATFKLHPSSSDSDESQGDDGSDDVFYHQSHTHNKVHTSFPADYSRNARISGSLNTGLPPLPSSGSSMSSSSKRRPYTSPGHHGCSSTDSYPSPLHHCSSPERRSIRSRSSRSVRSRHTIRRNRVHPEVKPKLAEFSQTSPVDNTTALKRTLSTSSHPKLDRFHSSSSSINSTLSAPVPPLLTSDLRRGGRMPSVDGGSWDFDAEAQLENSFPDKHIQVYVATWNMQEQKVGFDL